MRYREEAAGRHFYLVSGGLLLAGWSWITYNLRQPSGIPLAVCPFKAITGYPCPGCGTSRSVLALLHGAWADAWFWNPEGYPALLLLLLLPVWLIADLFTGRQTLFRAYQSASAALKRNKVLFVFFMLLILVNWIWNFQKHL